MEESPRPDQDPEPGGDAGANEGEMSPDRPTEDSEDTGTDAHQEAAAEQAQRSGGGA